MAGINIAAFDLAPQTIESSGFVFRKGKVFHAGNFPEKQFSMTPSELASAVAAFRPVPIDLEHSSTVLDGQLGELRAVELSADGRDLIGTAMLPVWLDKLLKDGQRKVSATFDRATKRIIGLALVNKPHVTDAVLMAAFSASEPMSLTEKYGHLFGFRESDTSSQAEPAAFADRLGAFIGTVFEDDPAERRRTNLGMTGPGREVLRKEDKAARFSNKSLTGRQRDLLAAFE